MSLTPELQRLAAKLDKQFAAEDREIIREAKRERCVHPVSPWSTESRNVLLSQHAGSRGPRVNRGEASGDQAQLGGHAVCGSAWGLTPHRTGAILPQPAIPLRPLRCVPPGRMYQVREDVLLSH